ncbi:MAG: CotH kinase family protein, partial [Sedimentisphaerales bacterium]
ELGPVDHGHRGWSWIALHDGRGKSLELMNPALPNEYGQNWTASNRDGGTPGARNSMAYDDIAPLIVDVMHLPIIPKAGDPVVVSARIIDEQPSGVKAIVHYRVDASTYQDEDIYAEYDPDSYRKAIMFDDGAHGDDQAGDGIYGAILPSQPDGAIVEFYIEATDAVTNQRTWPAPSLMDGKWQQVTNALYQVDNSFDGDVTWTAGKQPIYYLIMTETDKGRLLDIGDPEGGEYNSDAQVNATLVSVDGTDLKVRHNLGVRNRGHGSRDNPPNNYRVNFPHDRPWKGVTAVNLNTKYTYYQLAGSVLFRMSGLPQPVVTAVQVRLNGENLAGSGREMYGSYAHLEVVDSDYAANHFPDDPAGNAYKCMRDLGPADLRYRGTDPDAYRNSYFKKTNVAEDDWSDLIELCYVLSDTTPDDIYVEEVRRVIDVDEWLRIFAINSLLDNNETTLANGVGDDYYLYRGVADPRFVLIQHDLDTIFDRTGNPTRDIFRAAALPIVNRLLRHPDFVGRYYFQLRNLIETTFSPEQLRPLLNQFLGDFVPSNTIDNMMDYVAARNEYVLSVIPSQLTVRSSLPYTDGYYRSDTSTFTLYGTADPVETRSVKVDGRLAQWSPVGGTWDFGGAGGVTETLIDNGSGWKYLDDGSNQGGSSNGVSWFAHPSYDDSFWLEGPAELGYGDASQGHPEATVVNGGPNGDHFVTTYFRRAFYVDDASQYSRLHLRLLRDDGAIVYLNGVEIARSNMPVGQINYLTHANSSIGGMDEETFNDFSVDARLLQDGMNVLAVEVHQVSGSSSDVSFDLELEGITPSEGAGTLQPGINRVIVQTFDGPDGTGNELKRDHIDIWYDEGDTAQISGMLMSDTTLDAGSGPWYVTKNLAVLAGVTLSIEPGTTVFFDPGAGIIVASGGRLVAEGTEYKHIRLTSVPASGSRWDGIWLDQSVEDNRLSYVDMEYGDGQAQAIKIDRSRLAIDHVTWTRTDKNVLDVNHPRLVVSDSVFPDHDDEEAIYGYGLAGDEYLIIEGNTFGRLAGYQDAIDFSDCHLPGPIIRVYDNVFLGGEDDGLDLDSADAYVEGNVFTGFLGGSGTGTANAVAADQGSQITVVRNVFHDNLHAVLLKGGAQMRAENNTFVKNADSAINFSEPGSAAGGGAETNGNIFWDNAVAFENVAGQVGLTVSHSIVPSGWDSFGEGNVDADPLFVDPNSDLRLEPDSAAIGTGPRGLDVGAYVPSGAAISGEPDALTYRTDATLVVDGPGIAHYKYRLNNEPWSEERPVEAPIKLSHLLNGQSYTVYVIGGNVAGRWQSEDSPTASRTWTIDTSYSQLVINEVLAINHSAFEHEGTFPDLIELYYDGPAPLNLSGMSLSDDADDPAKFVFPSGTMIKPGEYLVLYADSNADASGIHLGFALDGGGEGLYLYDRDGTLLDSVEFGTQLPDLSIGRTGRDGRWRLTVPTFGWANMAEPLGDPRTLKINEWLADGLVLFEDDFMRPGTTSRS